MKAKTKRTIKKPCEKFPYYCNMHKSQREKVLARGWVMVFKNDKNNTRVSIDLDDGVYVYPKRSGVKRLINSFVKDVAILYKPIRVKVVEEEGQVLG
jgi:hypothetical protein